MYLRQERGPSASFHHTTTYLVVYPAHAIYNEKKSTNSSIQNFLGPFLQKETKLYSTPLHLLQT